MLTSCSVSVRKVNLVRHLVFACLTLCANAFSPATGTAVERWKQWELTLDGPSTGNPFVDVDFSATFTLATDDEEGAAPAVVAAPVPLVSLEFGMSGGAIHAFNRGTSNTTAPEAQVINAEVSVARVWGIFRGC